MYICFEYWSAEINFKIYFQLFFSSICYLLLNNFNFLQIIACSNLKFKIFEIIARYFPPACKNFNIFKCCLLLEIGMQKLKILKLLHANSLQSFQFL